MSVSFFQKTLSDQEYIVMQHLAMGLRYADIARKQGIALNTVQTYIKRAYAKLNVGSRAQAVYQMRLLGSAAYY